ncbi:MAG TPA: hypothetical protein VLW17_02325 [Thermoanaerobaculaceae bacterium]|nr:hypothetical protein [Thermoanaerobaculaceae bacterium]
MYRDVMGVTLAIIAISAAPCLASLERETASPSGAMAVGTGGGATLASPAPLRAPNPDETVVTGKVVMLTPVEVVVATASGLKRFAINKDTDVSPDVVEGSDVTLYAKGGEGAVQAATVQSASNEPSETNPTTAEAPTAPSSPSTDSGMEASQQPVASTPAETGTDSASGTAQPAAPAMKTLPKTASDLPLVGLIGLLSLGGAAALRLASKS